MGLAGVGQRLFLWVWPRERSGGLSVFCLGRLLFFLVLCLGRTSSWWGFSCLYPSAFPGCWLCQLQVWNMRGKEPQETHYLFGLCFLRSLDLLFFTCDSHLMCVHYKTCKIYSCNYWEKKCIYSIFPQMEDPLLRHFNWVYVGEKTNAIVLCDFLLSYSFWFVFFFNH